MNRDEALAMLNQIDDSETPLALDRFLQAVGMLRQEFDAASARSPEPYLTGLSQSFNAIRQRFRIHAT